MTAGATWRTPLGAALLAALAYLPSLWGGFLYDDQHTVLDNRAIQEGGLGTVLRSDPARPVLSLTWALNFAVSGREPWSYHLVNVLVHAATAALLASLFEWMGRRARRGEPGGSALLGASLFAVTPMAADTVAYVSSRSSGLAALFVLASLRAAVRDLESPSVRWRAGALALFLLALGTKEEAAALPLLLLLLDFFFVADQHPAGLVGRARRHVPFLVLPVLGLAARAAATGSWLPPPALDRGTYLATQIAVFPAYLLRTLVPLDPAFYRGQEPAAWPPQGWALLGWLAALGVAAGALALRRRLADWSFAVLWMGIALLPSSSLVPLKEMVADHRAYLGGAGVAYALGGALWPRRRGLALALLLVWAGVAVRYEWVLADPVRAWQDAAARAPLAGEAYLALGNAYAARGDRRAEWAYTRAAALEPNAAQAWTNLGVFYLRTSRLREAEAVMRGAVRALPYDGRIRDNLGMILSALGREEEAIAEFEAAIAADPALAQPRINLGAVLVRRGELVRARALLEEASRLELDPADAEALVRLQQQLGPP
ncbi:MAG: tetratricopeptide repeat protein [Acidobacteria bacterium]|nr:tetratricopeptide repeat protein [Acidobacteriota bacterium]